MVEEIIINTASEDIALIPDKWVLGTGLSTDQLYIMHTSPPLMIIQYPVVVEKEGGGRPTIVYVNGEVDPERLNRLFAEAWKILEIHRERTLFREP
jgi:hypothetical protein